MGKQTPIIYLFAALLAFVLTEGHVYSADGSRNTTPFTLPVRGVVLQGTSTLVLSRGDDTQAATEGEAFFCEGDPPINYHCANSYASYGCSEDCQCCYYEESYRGDEGDPLGLAAPLGETKIPGASDGG